jgi:actin related protein 2/3 complex subunit 1A/1B
MAVQAEVGSTLLHFLPRVTCSHLPVGQIDPLSLTGAHYSPSGHDSSISIVYPSGPYIVNVRSNSLPNLALLWTTEDTLVAAGHDCQPVVFKGSEHGWSPAGSLDDTTAPKSAALSNVASKAVGGIGRLNSAAFNTFKNADIRGQSGAPGRPGSPTTPSSAAHNESELLTVHQNTITSIRPYEGERGNVTKVATTGVDGKLVVWSLASIGGITGRMSNLRVR